jgi:hypothetical protein
MDREPWVLRNLRATRADPPSRARSDPYRRSIYGAALEQFEQLLQAAEQVNAAARPLPLFYALSQAGRAIVAARGDDPDIDGHGLAEDRQKPAPDDLLHRRVKRVPGRNNKDAFGAVARATGSPDLTNGAELGAVWATLPQTYRLPADSWLPEWRPALWIMDQPGPPAPGKRRYQAWSMSGNPHLDAPGTMRGRYPTLPRDTTYALKGSSSDLGPAGNWAVVLEWSEGQDFDKIAPELAGGTHAHALIPTLPEQSEMLTPLMTWWLLLFGLSIFARYHPGLWVDTLQVDRSTAAVPLEAVLDQALDQLPRLVYDQVIDER